MFTLKLHFPETSIYVSTHWFVYLMFNDCTGIFSYILRCVSSHHGLGKSTGYLPPFLSKCGDCVGSTPHRYGFSLEWIIQHTGHRGLWSLFWQDNRYLLSFQMRDAPTLAQAILQSSILYIWLLDWSNNEWASLNGVCHVGILTNTPDWMYSAGHPAQSIQLPGLIMQFSCIFSHLGTLLSGHPSMPQSSSPHQYWWESTIW